MNVDPRQTSLSRHLVDPELLPMIDAFPHTSLSLKTLPAFRELVATLLSAGVSEADQSIEQIHQIAQGANGNPDVRLAVYRPRERPETLPVILYIHGGGFVAGGIDAMEAHHRGLSAALQCCVVSVEYRLAPETKFPGAIEDCYSALSWVVHHSDKIGVSAHTIGLMGESAGGGLAAALALLARDRGEYQPAFQHLIYPMLDDRTAFHVPCPFAGEFLWTAEDNRFGWTSLLGTAAAGEEVSPYAAPSRSTDLSRLPPAFIMIGSLDLFANEGLEYARRLIQSGVSTELHVYPGGFHGFDLAAGTQVARAATQASYSALTRALGNALRA